ncbi:hypothetical protein [Niveibacterium sp.]|uniref:hypothetical protein n=1 Tax=Niveibacterium sp. TaxID=2017444 RepID=UPI0035AD98C1
MLERDKAYRLAGRKHRAHSLNCDAEVLRKRREVRFHVEPAGQSEQAVLRLTSVPGLVVERGLRPESLWITYSLADHSLEEVEGLLVSMGFHLDPSFYTRIHNAVIHYCEDTQLRNLRSPERLIKKSNEVYVKAWEHHPHGDHDDTPAELREYK